MSVTTADGTMVDVDALNREFARSMAANENDSEPVAPTPPKRDKTAPQPKTQTKKPQAKSTKTISSPASKPVHDKRAKAGSDILHSAAVITDSFYMATGDEAWNKDTELFASAAPAFGSALADVADHNPAFAKYLDSEGTGAATAYFALAVVSTQIVTGIVDNHNARGKIPLFFKAIGLRMSRFLGGNKRKRNAGTVHTQR